MSDVTVTRSLAKEIYTLVRVSGPDHVGMAALTFGTAALLLDRDGKAKLVHNRDLFVSQLDEAIDILLGVERSSKDARSKP